MATIYADFRPTQFDRNIRLDEHNDWIVAPVIRNRDSGILTESNWECQLDTLELAQAEYEIHRFGHWAHGWFDIALVHPDHAEVVEEIENRLVDYPVLNEDHYSRAEFEAIQDYWENMRLRERVELCHENAVSIFSARHDTAPEGCYERIQYWVNES